MPGKTAQHDLCLDPYDAIAPELMRFNKEDGDYREVPCPLLA